MLALVSHLSDSRERIIEDPRALIEDISFSKELAASVAITTLAPMKRHGPVRGSPMKRPRHGPVRGFSCFFSSPAVGLDSGWIRVFVFDHSEATMS